MFTTTYLASGWYEQFLKWIPEGEIFNLRVVFEAIPGILKELPNTILLTLAGAFFGLLLALLFAIVKINRVKILYPIQALFVSFLRGTPILINSLIGLTKGTSLAFYAGVLEIFAQAKIMSGNDSRYFERFISVSLIYWVINILIEQLGRWIEQVLAIKDPQVVSQTLQEEERAA